MRASIQYILPFVFLFESEAIIIVRTDFSGKAHLIVVLALMQMSANITPKLWHVRQNQALRTIC